MFGWVLFAMAVAGAALLWHSQRRRCIRLRNFATLLLLSENIRQDQRRVVLGRLKELKGGEVRDLCRAAALVEQRANQCATAAEWMAAALLEVDQEP